MIEQCPKCKKDCSHISVWHSNYRYCCTDCGIEFVSRKDDYEIYEIKEDGNLFFEGYMSKNVVK